MDEADQDGFKEKSEKPLMNEYDVVLDSMMKRLNCFQSNVAQIKDKYNEVIEENDQLSSQLKEILFCKINQEDLINYQDSFHIVANNLLQHMDLASKEKQILVEFCQVIMEKMSLIEEKVISSKYENQADQSQKSLDDMRIEYSEIILMLEAQLNTLRLLLINERQKKEQSLANAEILEKEYRRMCSEIANAKANEQIAEKNEIGIQKGLADLQMKHQQLKEELQASLGRESAAQDRIEESLNLVEAALYEKDVALIEKENSKEEVIQMKQAIDELIEDAGISVKKKVEDIKKTFNLRIQEMIGEMMKKEKECEKLQEELEKLTKKHRLLERQLEQMSQEQVKWTQGGQMTNEAGIPIITLIEQVSRLQAESADERDENNCCKRERKLLEDKLKIIADQQNAIGCLKLELETSKKNQSVLLKSTQDLTDYVTKLETELCYLKYGGSGDANAITASKYMVNVQENTSKSIDVHDLMNAQLEIKNKWREEVNNLTDKFCNRIKELHDEVIKLRLEKKTLKVHLRKK